jgi:hypothetical protein
VDGLRGALLAVIATAGCTPRAPATKALPADWMPPSCLVAVDGDRPDTLRVLGARLTTSTAVAHCTGVRADGRTPAIVALDAPPGTDLRDALEVGFGASGARPDVVVTRDPLAIAFAESRGAYVTSALPWRLTYVIVPSAAHPLFAATTLPERDALARDAVSASARGAREPFPWVMDSSCAAPAPSSYLRPRQVIAFDADDATARELAERIVALSGTTQAVPLGADSLLAAVASGRAAAAVYAIARDPRTRCTTARDAAVPLNAMPLVDVREHAIIRRGTGVAFIVSPDGSLAFIGRPRQ